ncbi:MAG: UDP-2,4-diacetamido-2,4,6-trideoxy-beta-L-altropyranose hydrolase [Pseudomonadota bacterium]
MARAEVDRHVVLRADAAPHIGMGHVMRCLALADVLRDAGWRCGFIMRAFAGHAADLVEARGHAAHLLPQPEVEPQDWLGVAQGVEITEARDLLSDLSPEWVVLDHYGLGADWVRGAVPAGCKTLVIDDLANRAHAGALLVDQTLGRKPADYADLWPAGTPILVGAPFALLHPIFARRAMSMPDRAGTHGVGAVLLALGGMDADDVTSAVIEALGPLASSVGLRRLDVALGATAPHLDRVRATLDQIIGARSIPCTLHVGVPDMADLMAGADLAIGAGGTMLWERCCLGLPTVAMCLADNQRNGLSAARHAGAIDLLPRDWQTALPAALNRLAQPNARRDMSDSARQLVDGLGCKRIATTMSALDMRCRRATPADAQAVFDWRSIGVDPGMNRQQSTPSLSDHIAWFEQAVQDRTRHMLIIEDEAGPVGHVRLDVTSKATARVSIALAPQRRGLALGAPTLCAGLMAGQRAGLRRFAAEIHDRNAGSIAVFMQLGFVRHGTDGAFGLYTARVGQAALPQMI